VGANNAHPLRKVPERQRNLELPIFFRAHGTLAPVALRDKVVNGESVAEDSQGLRARAINLRFLPDPLCVPHPGARAWKRRTWSAERSGGPE
jgi:hypothetical protein